MRGHGGPQSTGDPGTPPKFHMFNPLSLAKQASAGPFPECDTAGKAVGRLQSVSAGHGKASGTGALWELPACLVSDTALL